VTRKFPIRRVLTPLILAVVVVGAFFLLRKHVVWLDYFEGTISERQDRQTSAVVDRRYTEISEYYLVVDTDDGRQVTVPVEQLVYFEAREGMRIKKSPFTRDVHLNP
jgi:hypothetical protein